MENRDLQLPEPVLEKGLEDKPFFSRTALFRQLLICLLVVAGFGLVRTLPKDHFLSGVALRFRYAIRADRASTFGYLERRPLINTTLNWLKGSFRSAMTAPVATTNPAELGGFVPPVPGKIQRAFGWQTKIAQKGSLFYPGVDLSAPMGRPVRASKDGVVQKVTQETTGAWRVEISHKEGWRTVYANCLQVAVKVGDDVNTGQELAVSGKTAVGVHWEIWKDKHPIDPGIFIER